MENCSESFTAGSTSAPPPQPKEMPKFDGPASHFESMLKGMQELSSRLHAVADRLGGAAPSPVENTGQGSAGGGVAGRYAGLADSYGNTLRALFVAAERLERL